MNAKPCVEDPLAAAHLIEAAVEQEDVCR